jgi:hypothetical protein
VLFVVNREQNSWVSWWLHGCLLPIKDIAILCRTSAHDTNLQATKGFSPNTTLLVEQGHLLLNTKIMHATEQATRRNLQHTVQQ